MTRYFSAAETAKLVRADLKGAFPGVTFSVRSRTYSMGSHVDVKWTDGPATKAVERVTNRYSGRGMMDTTDRARIEHAFGHVRRAPPSCSNS